MLRQPLLALVLLFTTVNGWAQPQSTLSCHDVPGLAPLLEPGSILLLGEMHGTKESPHFLYNAACLALQQGTSVTVGLEIPRSERTYVDAFLDSSGDSLAVDRLLQGPIWQRAYQDGRASQAMLDLLEGIRRYRADGLPIRALLIDDPTIPSKRDSAMATHIHGAVLDAPDDVFLVLTGNVHNRMTRGTRWNAAYEPMGYQLRGTLGSTAITSLNVAHQGGEAWVCFGSTPADCGVRKIRGRATEGQGVMLFEDSEDQAYLGQYTVEALTASLPAVGVPPSVVITIDDLPYAGGPQRLDDVAYTAEQFVKTLARYDAPASGFVTGANVMVNGEVDARLDVLRQWRDGGVDLENHSFTHRSFHQIPLADYLDDAVQGLLFPEQIMREQRDSVRYYRHPFNHAGNTPEARKAFDAFLEERGLRLTPFTVEHADYLFNTLYVDARERGDTAMMTRLGEAYLNHLDTAFTFAEMLAEETFDRAIPHIFLIHANAINADYLGQMMGRLQARGYRFIALDTAMNDAAYATPDQYTGNFGISWLHRWRHSMNLEKRLRDEPDPPRWIFDAYQHLRSQ